MFTLVKQKYTSCCYRVRTQSVYHAVMSTLKERLKQLGKNQQEIADKAGVSKQAVTNWIKRNALSRESAERLADAYKVSLDWLLKGTGAMRAAGVSSNHPSVVAETVPQYGKASLSIPRLELALREVEEAAAMLGVKLTYQEKAARIAARYEAAAEPLVGTSGGSVSAAS